VNVGNNGTLTTGGNTTPGLMVGYWSLNPGSRLQATYAADLAEYYEGDREYEVGTVLVFGGDKEVTVSNIKGDTRVAGVVSDNAAFAMYEMCPGLKNLVALQGRVPCKVVGKIRKGDILVTSGIPGVAVAAGDNVKVGTVVGKALKDYDSDHIGTLEIAVGRT
jgi:trimeric autotransporter adhesin